MIFKMAKQKLNNNKMILKDVKYNYACGCLDKLLKLKNSDLISREEKLKEKKKRRKISSNIKTIC